MRKKKAAVLILCAGLAIAALSVFAAAQKDNAVIGINVVLRVPVNDAVLKVLAQYGKVRDVIPEIRGVTMQAPADKLAAVRAIPFVESAGPDAERTGAPVDTMEATDFMDGLSTWDLDAINVTDYGFNNRQVAYDGTGVYVAVLDTGLLDSWRQYFPQERIAVEYAKSFTGSPVFGDKIADQPNKWQHDQDSHGTHVTSTILGHQFGVNPVNGVAPKVTVIPVKVLNQNGSGWSSVIARGIVYVADLKKDGGPLASHPVVINMSLGGPVLDPMEKAAIDYAILKGVIIVASAGNDGTAGMGYPGAYAPVISVAASGWAGEWTQSGWWYGNVADPTNPNDFYITDFSSRQLAGQDLDVAAPGSWVVGPYQTQSGKTSYYFLGGTSMASPHVAGIVALMAQKKNALTASEAESILETSATYLAPGCRTVNDGSGNLVEFCWGADATGAGLAKADAALNAIP